MAKKQVFNTSAELNYPSVLPTLDLDFANSKTLDPRITFRRSSGGTYFGPDGRLRYAGVNEPRFDHNPLTGECLGLLVEEQRTNLLLQSEDFSTTWTGIITVGTNVAAAPNGTLTADKLIVNSGQSSGYINQSISFVAGTSYTLSVYVKADGISDFRVVLLAAIGGGTLVANLANGTVNTPAGAWTGASIVALQAGWFRVMGTLVPTATATSAPRWTAQGTGDGTSGIYIWGAQLEAGAFPTSYIPTTASAATRSADVASISGSAFSGFYNQSEGTVFAGFASQTGAGAFSFDDTTSSQRWRIGHNGTSAVNLVVVDGGAVQANVLTPAGSATLGSRIKVAGAARANDFQVCVDGTFLGTADTSGTMPSVSRATIGLGQGSTNVVNAPISRLVYWPQRLPNTTLQELTR